MSDEKINTYIQSLTTTHSAITISKYRSKLYSIQKDLDIDIHNASEQELWDAIENIHNVKLETIRRCQFILRGYRRFYELPTSFFDEKLKKDNTGLYINSDNPVAIVKEVKKLPDDYLHIIEGIENKNHKLLLRLITSYDEILRTDLGDVKITDIVDGVIVIKETKKTKMAVNIKLKPGDIDLIDFSKEYLIDINTVDRANGYSKTVRRLTKLYFGISLNQNFFRSRKATEKFKANEHLPLKQQLDLLKEDASKRAHGSSVAISHYINETDEVNVSLDFKKTINILKGDTVIHTYNLEDVIKGMNLLQAIKNL